MNDELQNMNEDWVECTFEDLLDYEQPTKYIVESTKYSDDYKTPVLTAGKTFIKGYTNETNGVFDNLPTIIFDDFTTASQFVNFKFKVKSSAMKILVPTSKLVNMMFAYYAMQVNRVRSDTHKRYWISVYAKKKILLPSLVEQRAIVSKIESLFSDLDNGIANLKKAQEQLKIYRQAVLKKAFEGELTKEWRKENSRIFSLPTAEELLQQIKEERQKHYEKQIEDWKKAVKEWEKKGKEGKKPSRPKAIKELPPLTEDELNELSKLPDKWIKIKMKDISLNITDGDHQAPPKSNEGIPFITISNIKENKIDFSNTFFVNIQYYNSLIDYRVPKRGDLLYTVTGSFGIPVLIDFDKKFCFQRHIGLIRPASIISNKWLYYLLQSQLIYRQASEKATGTAQKTVGLGSIRTFISPFCSIPEQHQIVQEIETRLSVCDKVEQSITESLEKSKALRQSILKKAFEGKLLTEVEIEQCKQEKDYEPASVLLEKIKAEKLAKEQEAKKTKKKKRK